MPRAVLLIFFGGFLALGAALTNGCGNDGEIRVRPPTTSAPATATPDPEAE